MAVYSLTSVDTAKKWHIMLIEQILGWFLEAAYIHTYPAQRYVQPI